MKYLHNFETDAQFRAEYDGTGYTEPWVSLTQANGDVNYNKSAEPLILRIARYGSYRVRPHDYPYTEEELEICDNFWDYFEVNQSTSAVTMVRPIKFYFVGGIVSEFDPEDPETYMFAFVPEEITYSVGGGYERFSMNDGECLVGYFDFSMNGDAIFEISGEAWDNCHS